MPRYGDREAPRSEPRRDRRARLPHRAARSGSRPSRSSRRTTAARCTPARPTRRSRSRRYLDAAEHVRAARAAGADAIHPGYGFLAESADFAEAVEAAGLTWVGPPPAALRAGGDKLESKRIAPPRACRSCRRDTRGARLPAARQGGGGRRRARHARRPRAGGARGRARGRAPRGEAAFGDDRSSASATSSARGTSRSSCSPTAHGTVVALGERECSVQRRHQKVLEESPSPALDADLRAADERRRGRASRARSATRARARPSSCSTGRDFFFLELNGRIQVEHPVTEVVTGHRPRRRAAPHRAGRAARRPCRDCCTATRSRCGSTPRTRGRSCRRRAGSSGCGCPAAIRVDAGVAEGDEVGTAYDPMIAKLIAHGATRDEALDRLAAALAETEVARRDDEPAVPALARRAPGAARRRDDDRVPRRASAALGAARALPTRPVARRLPAQPARAAAGAAAATSTPPRTRTAPASEQSAVDGADARHRDQRARRRGRPRRSARQPLVVLEAMKMETPLVVALRGDGRARSTSPRATASPAARCSSSSRTRLEQLLQLHGGAHVALDLQLAGHVGGRRVLLAGDDLLEGLARRS